MKKILLAALAALTLAGTVQAQATATHWTYKDLAFRSHAATAFSTVQGAFNDFGTLDAVDSVYASGIAKFDTTTSLSTAGWAVPNRIGSAVDSALVCRLFIFDAGASAGLTSVTLGRTSATAESIYVKAQVSANNVDWFDLAVIAGQAPVLNAWTAQTTVNAAVITFVTSTNTGISGKMWSLPYYSAQNAAGLRHGMDISHIGEFPYVRWIISGTRATTNHALKAKVGFWTTNASVSTNN